MEWELRAGRQPCQNKRVLKRARQLTDEPLLLCLDSGNDAMENIAAVENHNEPNEMAAPDQVEPAPEKPRALAGLCREARALE